MSKKNIIFIIGTISIIMPFFINVYSIYKLIFVCLGIILFDISLAMNKRVTIFYLIYFPIILLLITYGIDYFKTYTFNLSPIYVFEQEINSNVSIYNSLFYRIYKCEDKYILDNQYKKNFACDNKLLEEININKLLNEPGESYKNYRQSFIKVRGKISKINGTSSIILQAYTEMDGEVNGHVKFDETSKLIINLDGIDISNYRIYDYITIVGVLDKYNNKTQELTLVDSKVEENNLYNNYEIQVIESSKCDNEINKYTDNLYTYCIDNIYLDYKVDKYELSYALKDKKIKFEDLIDKEEFEREENYKLYKLEKINILACNNKNILIIKNSKVDYSWCE
ncbi:MAG: hypothetical protein E7161_00925 [Firmicutes bacterium]|nr:hypothetical protein [Bacillota bacterium]